MAPFPGGVIIKDRNGNIAGAVGVSGASGDEDEYWNQDIFSLKGRNALGFEFYAPMQNVWNNGTYDPLPFSAVDIVATEDNTVITIKHSKSCICITTIND